MSVSLINPIDASLFFFFSRFLVITRAMTAKIRAADVTTIIVVNTTTSVSFCCPSPVSSDPRPALNRTA